MNTVEYCFVEYYSAIKMKETYFIWVGLEGIMLKWNKSDRERQILNDLTYNVELQKLN